MGLNNKPKVLYTKLDSRAYLIRFDSLHDIFWYDKYDNNVGGIAIKSHDCKQNYLRYNQHYFKYRNKLTPNKRSIINSARKSLSLDRDFLDIVYKAKSNKRKYVLNKFGGNLSMSHYASQNEKIFKKNQPGAKKVTLNLAFQVGTFRGENYQDSFIKILKIIMMCQALNISVNIDMFDSDTNAIDNGPSYVICNVCKSSDKINFKNILTCSHEQFFNTSLFNGYSASGKQASIGTFLSEDRIINDLSTMYDVIGGNTLKEVGNSTEEQQMISRVLKIGLS